MFFILSAVFRLYIFPKYFKFFVFFLSLDDLIFLAERFSSFGLLAPPVEGDLEVLAEFNLWIWPGSPVGAGEFFGKSGNGENAKSFGVMRPHHKLELLWRSLKKSLKRFTRVIYYPFNPPVSLIVPNLHPDSKFTLSHVK